MSEMAGAVGAGDLEKKESREMESNVREIQRPGAGGVEFVVDERTAEIPIEMEIDGGEMREPGAEDEIWMEHRSAFSALEGDPDVFDPHVRTAEGRSTLLAGLREILKKMEMASGKEGELEKTVDTLMADRDELEDKNRVLNQLLKTIQERNTRLENRIQYIEVRHQSLRKRYEKAVRVRDEHSIEIEKALTVLKEIGIHPVFTLATQPRTGAKAARKHSCHPQGLGQPIGKSRD